MSKLKEVESSADADEFQTAIFSVGKNSVYKENIKEFFKLFIKLFLVKRMDQDWAHLLKFIQKIKLWSCSTRS